MHKQGNKRKRIILILLPLFLLILLLLYYTAGNHKAPIRPVVLDSNPVGMIWPDSGNGNRNTAQAAFSIKNPSSKSQSVTFQITYELLLSEKHFTFDIEHLYVEDEEGTFRELPGTVMEIPGNTTPVSYTHLAQRVWEFYLVFRKILHV